LVYSLSVPSFFGLVSDYENFKCLSSGSRRCRERAGG
jgi:hypothetical protein